jgi:DNA uptake protein ComE-like DNA-binding protein
MIDLNSSDPEQLQGIGLDPESANRLIENRPYRNKLDLLSRMVLAPEVYSDIKNKIGIADAGDPIKIA